MRPHGLSSRMLANGREDQVKLSEVGELTMLLRAHDAGDGSAMEKIYNLIYTDLRMLASRQIDASRTLSATGLVHECYLRFRDAQTLEIKDREHFFRLAARVMRQVVIDNARARSADKRGAGVPDLPLDENLVADDPEWMFLLELEEALNKLDDERLIAVFECRYFAGMSETETASALDVSTRTVQREWQNARKRLADLLTE